MKTNLLLILTVILLFTASSVYAEEPPLFSTFGEAANAAMETVCEGESLYCISSEGYCVALIKRDGRFFRAVTFFDEHGYELYSAFIEANEPEKEKFAEDEYRTLEEYLMKLPVQYTEELTVIPFTQEELDAMVGKTIKEMMSEPWEMGMRNYPENAEENGDVVFPMVKGFCEYELVINEPFEVYQERRACDHYDPVTIMSLKNYLDLTVKHVRYTGISSSNALNLHYLADGTIKRDIEVFPEGYDYDLMVEIADYLADVWAGVEPSQETKDAMISELTAEHPEAADMIRQIVESFH